MIKWDFFTIRNKSQLSTTIYWQIFTSVMIVRGNILMQLTLILIVNYHSIRQTVRVPIHTKLLRKVILTIFIVDIFSDYQIFDISGLQHLHRHTASDFRPWYSPPLSNCKIFLTNPIFYTISSSIILPKLSPGPSHVICQLTSLTHHRFCLLGCMTSTSEQFHEILNKNLYQRSDRK